MLSAAVPDEAGTLRLFVALTPPPDVQRALATAAVPLLDACGAAARGVAPHAVHLTLRFLGETAFDRVAALRDGLAGAAAAGPPLTLVVAGAGAFPTLARPQVLWLGLAANVGLGALYDRVDGACAAAGFGRESRPFRAHLTVARFRRGARVDRAALERALGAVRPPDAFVVSALGLVSSTLGAGGARHEVLARLPLGGRACPELG